MSGLISRDLGYKKLPEVWEDMKRFITFGSVALMAAVLIFQDKNNNAYAAGPDSVSIGYAISLSGPFAPGAGATQWPIYMLWV